MTTPARKTVWTFIQVIYVLSSVLQFPVARGTLTPDGTVSFYLGSHQTFTCTVTGAAAWTISGLEGITATESTGLVAANNNSRITTTDSSGITPSSTITISRFTKSDRGGTIQCINLADNSVQGMATMSILEGITPDGIVRVNCGDTRIFICSGYRKDLRWNITGLRGIVTTEPFLARLTGISNSRINSTDTGDTNQFDVSVIKISGFSAADNGGTIQCINMNDSSVQGTATISIKNSIVPIDQAAVTVPVLEGGTAIFTCKFEDGNDDDSISWSLTSVEGVHTDINPNGPNVTGSSGSFLNPDRTQLVIAGVQNSLNGTRVECHPASTDAAVCTETVYISVHNFTTLSPALIKKITLSSRLAVVIVWSVPGFVVDYIDGSVISVVMVTPNGPKAIRQTRVGKRVIAFAVDFPEKGARYQVTVHMTMNGLYSKPLDVELDV